MAILRLSENVVAMIAAGEAVERPSAVVKELVENSLDAGSSEIKVEIDGGGLEFLSVSDNGHGIEAKDFELLCERHATSKITKYDDIENVKTFGFRGEALASISAVSKITVVSKPKNDKLASKGVFVNGKLASPIEVSAGLNGTRITVENLFYNIPLRQRIFSFSLKEEKTRSLDIVKKYAIDNPKINFIYAKQSHNKNRLCSPLTKQNGPTPLTMIKLFYGQKISEKLIQIRDGNDAIDFEGCISKTDLTIDKPIHIFFVNKRLVSWKKLSSDVQTLYKNSVHNKFKTFFYFSAKIDRKLVDANVHPKKEEVLIRNEDEILSFMIEKIKSKIFITSSEKENVIKTLPESLKTENCNLRSKRKITEKRQNGVESIPTRPKDTVRVELFKNQDRTIKSFFDDIDKKSTSIDNNDKKSTSIDNNDKKSTSIVVKDKKSISKRFDPKNDLSFQEWLSNLKRGRDERVSKILKNFVYVGDINGYLMLIQCGKKLLSLNLKPIFKVLLKQNFLANRKNADILRWEKPLVVEEEISSYMSKKKRRKGKDQSRSLSRKMCSLLVAKRTQLRKVGITISEKGALESIPDLLPEMEILKERTGKFLWKMAEEAREDPKFGQSLESLDRILSFFWILYLSKDEGISADASRDTFMKSVLVPKVRKVYPLATFLDDKTFVQISSLDRFYSSFERC